MTGRFLNFLGLVALYVMVGVLVGVALYLATRPQPTRYEAASPSARHAAAFSAPETSTQSPDAPDDALTPFSTTRPAPIGGGGAFPAGGSNPLLPSANQKVRAGSGLGPTGSGGASPPPSFPATCQSVCAVDVSFPDDEPTPIPSVSLQFVVRSGIASTYGPGWSERWVALPDGPGWRFRVCGAGGCRTLVSTDAGPSLAMQRAGRIVDLPVGAFEAVCGVSYSRGLCQVSLTILGRAR